MNLSWRGYRLIAADGSGMRLPSSEEIVSEFEPNGTTGTAGNLFVDLCTSLICSARLAAWEQTLAEEQLPEVITQMRSLNQKPRTDKICKIKKRNFLCTLCFLDVVIWRSASAVITGSFNGAINARSIAWFWVERSNH